MGLIAVPNTFSAGELIIAAEHNQNFTTIYSEFNGNISNANISDTAAIVDTKLATIATLAKVNVTALIVASQAAGDLLYAAGATSWSRLAAGTSSQVLRGGTTPSWGTIPAAAQLPGTVVQVVNFQSGAVATGSTAFTVDANAPQNTYGTEFMTLAVTPNSATNKLKIDVVWIGARAGTDIVGIGLFQDSTVLGLASSYSSETQADEMLTLTFSHFMTAATAISTTFKVRVGSNSGSTMTFNGRLGAVLGGGTIASSITITEIKV